MKEMADSSIYAMTSISEAFPFVLLEAMYNKLSIVAYDVRVGPRTLIKPDETGYLVTDNDTEAFAATLSKLMETPKLLSKFQNNAFRYMRSFCKITY